MRRYTLLLTCFLFVSLCVTGKKTEPLKLTIFGDSYSTFENYLTPDTNYVWYFSQPRNMNDVCKVEQTWWWQVKERMGWSIERVNSFSGSTICCTGYSGKDATSSAFITRMANLGEPDVILVCGATNDSWAGSPIGDYKYGEWTREELFSFRPALAKMCWGLRAHYPKARVLFLLNSELKEEINESVHTVCAHYDIPVLDLHDVDKQKGHPSIAGMQAIAQQVEEWVRKHWK